MAYLAFLNALFLELVQLINVNKHDINGIFFAQYICECVVSLKAHVEFSYWNEIAEGFHAAYSRDVYFVTVAIGVLPNPIFQEII